MKNIPEVKGMTKEEMLSTSMSVVESEAMRATTEHTTKKLDASYEKANLEKLVTKDCLHLDKQEKELLLKLLREYETLFNGILGDFKTSPVSLKVKEKVRHFQFQRYTKKLSRRRFNI